MYFDSRIECASSVAVLYAIVMMLISLLADHSCTILQIWYRFLWKFVPGYILKAITWWRHQMETFSALLAICAGNSPVAGEFPAQRPVARNFDVFFDLRLNERLSKHSWCWWLYTPSSPLWRHSNEKMSPMCSPPDAYFSQVMGSRALLIRQI